MDIKDSYLHGTVGVVKSISVAADKLKYTLADIAGTVREVTLPVATQTANGLLSKEDKKKLDNMVATKVANDLILKINSGTTEGTSLYTYNGSAAKTLDIKNGTGIGFATNAESLTIYNSGVRSIATGTTNGTISVNTNGTSADVAVKGLGSAAYTSSDTYVQWNNNSDAYYNIHQKSNITDGHVRVLYSDVNNTSVFGYGYNSTNETCYITNYKKGYSLVLGDNLSYRNKTIAYTDSNITGNAASADKLKTSRKLWGLDFDGTKDIKGRLSIVSMVTYDPELLYGIHINGSYYNSNLTLHDIAIYSKNITTIGGGNVGINTVSPSERLDVNGNVKATAFIGNLDGTYVNALTGYAKADSASDLAATDTLNSALGKLEYKADTAYSWYRTITDDDTDDIINKWDEVVDFVNGLEVDLTDEFVTRKTDLEITGTKTFTSKIYILSPSDNKIILNNTQADESKILGISFQQDGVQYGALQTWGTNDILWNKNKIYHAGNLKNLSDLNDDVVSGNYLPLSGGTLNGGTNRKVLILDGNAGSGGGPGVYINYKGVLKAGVGYNDLSLFGSFLLNFNSDTALLVGNDKKLWFCSGANALSKTCEIYHTGNLTNLSQLNNDLGFVTGGPYLPLSGGTMTGPITLTSGSNASFDKTALSFVSQTGTEQVRIGTNSSNNLGIYSTGNIYLKPNSSFTANGPGVSLSSTEFTYNNYNVLHEGNISNYLGYIGTTAVQKESKPQSLHGINSIHYDNNSTNFMYIGNPSAVDSSLTNGGAILAYDGPLRLYAGTLLGLKVNTDAHVSISKKLTIGSSIPGNFSLNLSGVAMFNQYNASGNVAGPAVLINRGSNWFGLGPSSANISLMSFGDVNPSDTTWKNELMTFTLNLKVGINKTNPAYTLHVGGIIYSDNGFIKKDSSDSYVLLGGGGHKAVSDFATAASLGDYLPLAGGNMTGNIVLLSSTTSGATPKIYFQRGTTSDSYYDSYIYNSGGSVTIGVAYGGSYYDRYTMGDTHIRPNLDNKLSLGRTTERWADVNTVLLNGYTPITSNNIGSYAWTPDNDGTGSGLDADLLDGYHANVKDIENTIAIRDESSALIAKSFKTTCYNKIVTSIGWYRIYVGKSASSGYNQVLLHLGRNYQNASGENYTFSITVSSQRVSITRLSGTYNVKYIEKIRIAKDSAHDAWYIDYYRKSGSANSDFVSGIGSGTFQLPTLVEETPVYSVEFDTGRGCKSESYLLSDTGNTYEQGFVGDLQGNASSATKLQTPRTIWGQSFDGTANIADKPLSGVFEALSFSRENWNYICVPATNGNLAFNIGIAGTANTKMCVLNNGNVGIGNVDAAYPLTVVGKIYSTSGFLKANSSNDYILLGGGGHKLVSDFAKASDLSNYLPLTGGTLTGKLELNYPGWPLVSFKKGGTLQGYIGFSDVGIPVMHNTLDWKVLLHSGNYTDYTVKKDGTGAEGTWGISITGNAGSASTSAKLSAIEIITTKEFSLSNASWTNTGYTFESLSSGTYAVQVTCGNLVASGIMSVYKNIDDTAGDEIPLHVYHDSTQPWRPYLRTSGKKLLISSNDASALPRKVTIKIALIL